MASRGFPISLGPFNGGLNTTVDPTAVADNEAAVLKNFEVDGDGSLVQRPPIIRTSELGAWTKRMLIIGNYIAPSGVSYLVGCDNGATGVYVWDGANWTLIKANCKSYWAAQYNDKLYVLATQDSATVGGLWDPVGGWFDHAAMPRGSSAVFYKSRMWVVPGIEATANKARLVFSNPIVYVAPGLLTWTATDIVDVSPGDGQNLVDISIQNDNLILHKSDSTYVFAYDIRPADAVLRVLSTRIGASGKHCVIQYENTSFVYHDFKVWELTDYSFKDLTVKLKPEYDATPGATRLDKVYLCIIGERLLWRFYNRVYVFRLDTGAWCEYVTEYDIGRFVEYKTNDDLTPYYAGSSIEGTEGIFRIYDGYSESVVHSSDYDCIIETRVFDFDEPFRYKKLLWWGVDVKTPNQVIGKVTPMTIGLAPTWDEVGSLTWDELEQYTWNTILAGETGITTTVPASNAQIRIFVKLMKTMRFRMAKFTVTLTGNGGIPARLFGVAAILRANQVTPKQVN